MLFISEVRIKLPRTRCDGSPLLAYAKVVLNRALAIQDLRVIEGAKGPFVSMPSRKMTDHCPKCDIKNHMDALYCIVCKHPLDPERVPRDDRGRQKLYVDLVFPINQETREMFNLAIIPAYEYEVMLAEQPGYVCTYDEPQDHCEDPLTKLLLVQPNGESGRRRPRTVWKGNTQSPFVHKARRLSLRL